jgi:hypothetical protein
LRRSIDGPERLLRVLRTSTEYWRAAAKALPSSLVSQVRTAATDAVSSDASRLVSSARTSGPSSARRNASARTGSRAGAFAALFARTLGFDAPDQQVHSFERALPGFAVLALLNLDQQQHLDPLLVQELEYRLRRLAGAQAHLDLGLGHGLGERQAFLLFDLLLVGQRLLFDALVLFVHQGLELFAHLLENPHVVFEIFQQVLENRVEADERRIRGIDVFRQARCDLTQGVEHLPCWMGLLGKERLVRDRDLEERDLQPADQALDPDRDPGIVEQLVEQQRHDVERHRVHMAHAAAQAGSLESAQNIGGAGLGHDRRQRHGIAGHRAQVADLHPGE